MKILVLEWLVGGGLVDETAPPSDCPMLTQGASMFAAVVNDCLKIGWDVVAPIDCRMADTVAKAMPFQHHPHLSWVDVGPKVCLKALIQQHAGTVGRIMLIAPESDGILRRCLSWVPEYREKLVCGPPELIELFADKNRTQEYLSAHGVAVPTGCRSIAPHSQKDSHANDTSQAVPHLDTEGLSFPIVVKSADGAGADGVFICHDRSALEEVEALISARQSSWRIEQFIVGKPVSVSLLQSNSSSRLLPPTGQCFSRATMANDGGDAASIKDTASGHSPGHSLSHSLGHYRGTEFPLPQHLAERSTALAQQVTATIPNWRGYLGIDMILGDDENDFVVEINPRMTMSYCHLRTVMEINAMEFMLKD